MRFQEIIEGPAKLKKASPQEVTAALTFMKSEMRRTPAKYQPTYREIQANGAWMEFDVRNWGEWEVPEGEEDDGDYDWEVLTNASGRLLTQIKAKAMSQFPNVTIEFQTSEKNWIMVSAKSAL